MAELPVFDMKTFRKNALQDGKKICITDTQFNAYARVLNNSISGLSTQFCPKPDGENHGLLTDVMCNHSDNWSIGNKNCVDGNTFIAIYCHNMNEESFIMLLSYYACELYNYFLLSKNNSKSSKIVFICDVTMLNFLKKLILNTDDKYLNLNAYYDMDKDDDDMDKDDNDMDIEETKEDQKKISILQDEDRKEQFTRLSLEKARYVKTPVKRFVYKLLVPATTGPDPGRVTETDMYKEILKHKESITELRHITHYEIREICINFDILAFGVDDTSDDPQYHIDLFNGKHEKVFIIANLNFMGHKLFIMNLLHK
jgi:hypothetical protein